MRSEEATDGLPLTVENRFDVRFYIQVRGAFRGAQEAEIAAVPEWTYGLSHDGSFGVQRSMSSHDQRCHRYWSCWMMLYRVGRREVEGNYKIMNYATS